MTRILYIIVYMLAALTIISCSKPDATVDPGDAAWVKVIADSPVFYVDRIREDASQNLYCAYSHKQGTFNFSSTIAKIDNEGNLIWRRSFEKWNIHDFKFDGENNVIAAVSEGPVAKIIKIEADNSNYFELGSCSTSQPGIETVQVLRITLQITLEGNYHLSGTALLAQGVQNTTGFVIGLSADGSDCWKKVIVFNPVEKPDIAISGSIADGNEYILFGSIQYSSPDTSSFFIMRTDADGNSIWTRVYKTSYFTPPGVYSGYYCETSEIVEGNDGNFYGAAFNVLYNLPGLDNPITAEDDNSARVFQFSPEGDILKTLNIKYGHQNEVAGIAAKVNGGLFIGMNPNKLGNFAAVGKRNSFIVNVSPDFTLESTVPVQSQYSDYLGSVCVMSDGHYAIECMIQSFGKGQYNLQLIKTDPNGNF